MSCVISEPKLIYTGTRKRPDIYSHVPGRICDEGRSPVLVITYQQDFRRFLFYRRARRRGPKNALVMHATAKPKNPMQPLYAANFKPVAVLVLSLNSMISADTDASSFSSFSEVGVDAASAASVAAAVRRAVFLRAQSGWRS